MTTKSIPLYGKQSGLSGSWIMTLLRRGYELIKTVVSLILLMFMNLFFFWINKKQNEFDNWEGKQK